MNKAEQIVRRNALVRSIKDNNDTLFLINIPFKGDRRRWRIYTIAPLQYQSGGKPQLWNITNNVARICGFRFDNARWALIGEPFDNDASAVREAIRDILATYDSADVVRKSWAHVLAKTFEFTRDPTC